MDSFWLTSPLHQTKMFEIERHGDTIIIITGEIIIMSGNLLLTELRLLRVNVLVTLLMTAWTVIPCAKNNLELWVITDGQSVVMVMICCKNMYLYITVVQKRELLARFVFIRRPILRLIRIILSLWCRLWAIGFFSPERLHQWIIIIITRGRISAYQQATRFSKSMSSLHFIN